MSVVTNADWSKSDQSVAELKDRLASRLLPEPQVPPPVDQLVPDWTPVNKPDKPPVPAAVLVALVRRGAAWNVLYTERSSALRSHSGQVSFPGGKMDPEDVDAASAALREASEEVALNPVDARVMGYLPFYFTGTNYLITPVVAEIHPRNDFVANPDEVDSVFEVPLSHVLNPEAYSKYYVFRHSKEHWTWQVSHPEKLIWGITANMTRRLFDLVHKAEQ